MCGVLFIGKAQATRYLFDQNRLVNGMFLKPKNLRLAIGAWGHSFGG